MATTPARPRGGSRERNGATVLTCRMDFDVATITARATSRTWWGHRWAFEQKARAAPDFYLGE